tara:strand:+ start:1448 stop:2233 length:786 start_codon:yes stop_codon:yes gene_type:complete
MDTGQLYELFDQLIDEVSTADADEFDKGQYCNLAISDLIHDRIKPKHPNKTWSLQAHNRVRAELGPIYVGPHTPTMNGNLVVLPTNFDQVSYLRMENYQGTWVPVLPNSGSQSAVNQDSSFIDKHEEPFYEQVEGGLYVHTDQVEYVDWAPTTVELWYIKKFTEVRMYEQEFQATAFNNGDTVVVRSGNMTISGTTYYKGDTFTFTTTPAWSGFAYLSKIINSELPDSMQREVARRAAILFLKAMGDEKKAAAISADEVNS